MCTPKSAIAIASGCGAAARLLLVAAEQASTSQEARPMLANAVWFTCMV